jgi:hypothetical protein
MPNTGERREIKRYVNAKENQTVQEAKKLVSKTKQRAEEISGEELARKLKNVPSKLVKKVPAVKSPLTDQQAANRMVDEGNPNVRP